MFNKNEGGEKMRLKLVLKLQNEVLPIQYRKNILSFIKKSLSEYSEEYYKKLYDDKKPTIKPKKEGKKIIYKKKNLK